MGGSNFDPNRFLRNMQKSMDSDPGYQAGRKSYKRAVAKGLGAIGLAAFIFVATMFYVSAVSLSYVLWLCLGAGVILLAAIVYASIVIKRAQAGYMGSAEDAAEKAADEMMKEELGKRKK